MAQRPQRGGLRAVGIGGEFARREIVATHLDHAAATRTPDPGRGDATRGTAAAPRPRQRGSVQRSDF
ncbi:MAG: hypothetical protein ACK56S_03465 [Planctomycetota bacterium]